MTKFVEAMKEVPNEADFAQAVCLTISRIVYVAGNDIADAWVMSMMQELETAMMQNQWRTRKGVMI